MCTCNWLVIIIAIIITCQCVQLSILYDWGPAPKLLMQRNSCTEVQRRDQNYVAHGPRIESGSIVYIGKCVIYVVLLIDDKENGRLCTERIKL